MSLLQIGFQRLPVKRQSLAKQQNHYKTPQRCFYELLDAETLRENMNHYAEREYAQDKTTGAVNFDSAFRHSRFLNQL